VTDLFKKAGIKYQIKIAKAADIKKAIISTAKENSCDAIVTGTMHKKVFQAYSPKAYPIIW
jgi:hypothetical protein